MDKDKALCLLVASGVQYDLYGEWVRVRVGVRARVRIWVLVYNTTFTVGY